jgi:hypothetical protein
MCDCVTVRLCDCATVRRSDCVRDSFLFFRRFWWEAVVMFQRSLLALVFAVGLEQPGLQAIVITLLCMAFVIAQYWCHPLQDSRANSMQVRAVQCNTLDCALPA